MIIVVDDILNPKEYWSTFLSQAKNETLLDYDKYRTKFIEDLRTNEIKQKLSTNEIQQKLSTRTKKIDDDIKAKFGKECGPIAAATHSICKVILSQIVSQIDFLDHFD